MLTPSEMKDRMHDLARTEGLIEGIYNYCDRWCERCAFTSKCLNYASSKEAPSSDGPELWDYLHIVFEATMLMLDEMMEKMGIDPEEINKMEPQEDLNPKDHPLYKKVYELSFTIHKWLEQNKPGVPSPEKVDLLPPEDEKTHRFHDALEVVYFYNFFISAKIFRALSGVGDFDQEKVQTDSNGSAKIALIALDRLIAAWSVVLENLMEYEDEILKFLITLAETRKQAEITFPLARKFLRPGFDDQ